MYSRYLIALAIIVSNISLAEPLYNNPDRVISTLTISGFPKEFRFFANGEEETDTIVPRLKAGVLKHVFSNTKYGKKYIYRVRVEAQDAQGRGYVWEKNINFIGGEDVVVQVNLKRVDGTAGTPPTPPAVSGSSVSKKGRLHFVVTLDTKLFINGKLTQQEGEIRDFYTRDLKDGEIFDAKVKFDFRNRTGRRIIRTKTFKLRAGQTIEMKQIENLAEEIVPGE